jgi:hypothetical protein
VTATDSAQATASDVFCLTVAKGSQGGCGGHGNEGVGNGHDAPPPGHDYNHNDGDGSSPGHPGSQGGRHDDPDNGHGRKDDDKVGHSIDKLLSHCFDTADAYQPIHLSLLDEITHGQSYGVRTETSCYAEQWQRLNGQMDNHLAAYGGNLGCAVDHGHTCDAPQFQAEISRNAASGKALSSSSKGGMPVFSGLKEGVSHLSW